MQTYLDPAAIARRTTVGHEYAFVSITGAYTSHERVVTAIAGDILLHRVYLVADGHGHVTRMDEVPVSAAEVVRAAIRQGQDYRLPAAVRRRGLAELLGEID